METNNTISNILTGQTTTAPGTGKEEQLGQTEFLELMLAQLKNQDPFKPMEGGEFLGQMAQFGTVSGIQELQSSFRELSSSLVSSQALQASTLVGREVQVPGSAVQLDNGGLIKGAVELPSSVDELLVSIFDSSGQLVRRFDLGGQPGGKHNFAWDGMTGTGQVAPPGTYMIDAQARVGREVFGVDTYVNMKVSSVLLDSNASHGIQLNLSSGEKIDFSIVREIK